MKHLVIFFLLIGFSVFVTTTVDSYGLIMGHPMEFWDGADIILDGTVVSTTNIDSENLVRHDIQVEQIFKNQKPQQMITVYGPNRDNEQWFYPKFFEQGDRVLFYLKQVNDKHIILEHSRKATEQCMPRDMIGLSTLPGEDHARGGPALFFNPYQTCNGFLTPAGMVRDSLPPLKQLESGITPGDVNCRNDNQLMFRGNGSVACVKKSSVSPLMDMGWMHVDNQRYLQFRSALPTILLDMPKQVDDSTPLDFIIEVTDFVENNNIPVITISDEEKNIVWSGEPHFHDNAGWVPSAGSGHRSQYTMDGHPEKIMMDPGTYTISISLENQKITKKLNVLESEPSQGIDESGFADYPGDLDDFVFTFYSQVAKQDGSYNVFFSPISISTAFSIAYEGAKGETASQIQQVFGFEENDSKRHQEVSDTLSRFNHEDDWYKLQIANALWVKEGYQLKQDYTDTAKMYYSSTVDNVNFVTNDGVNRINDWVKEKTNDKIQDILDPESTDELTAMVITNAVYFKGKWGMEFNPNNTSERQFWTDKNNTVTVPMMREPAAMYNYAETDSIQALELNYLGGDVSMIILLPKEKDGLQSLEQSVNRKMFDSVKNSMTQEPLTVQIPKFDFETKYNLIDTLKDLDIRDAFDKSNADFHGITDAQIYLDKAVHKAFVNVNEEGTEAAAITALVGRFTSGPPEPVEEFVADHPFMFVIQEKDTGEILFIGRVMDPTK